MSRACPLVAGASICHCAPSWAIAPAGSPLSGRGRRAHRHWHLSAGALWRRQGATVAPPSGGSGCVQGKGA
eukprot:321873-Alexandrium_andersonii.AAC.1